MAQQTGTGIARVGGRKWGYDPEQVDAFLERAHALYERDGVELTQGDIQNASFALTRGGYVIAQVDAALSRLERAVVDKATSWQLSHEGPDAWRAAIEKRYRQITDHLDRPAGFRFDDGKPKFPSYDRKQVDRLGEQVADKAAAALGLDGVRPEDIADLDHLTAETVATSVFTQRKGKKGYDERQVDYFLDACVQLLSGIESYERVGNTPLSELSAASGQAASDRASSAQAEQSGQSVAGAPVPATSAAPASVAPLFTDSAQYQHSTEQSAPAAIAMPQTFDALQQAEEHLFAAPAAAAAAASAKHTPVPAVPPAPAMPESFAPAHAPARPSSRPTVVPPAAPVNEAPPAVPPAPVAAHAPSASSVPASPAPANHAAAPTAYPPVTPHSGAPHSGASHPAPVSSAVPAGETNSLAALAQMAEASQEIPVVEAQQAFTPSMPKLDQPSISLFGNGVGGIDTDIPDLSFPSFIREPEPAKGTGSGADEASSIGLFPSDDAEAGELPGDGDK